MTESMVTIVNKMEDALTHKDWKNYYELKTKLFAEFDSGNKYVCRGCCNSRYKGLNELLKCVAFVHKGNTKPHGCLYSGDVDFEPKWEEI